MKTNLYREYELQKLTEGRIISSRMDRKLNRDEHGIYVKTDINLGNNNLDMETSFCEIHDREKLLDGKNLSCSKNKKLNWASCKDKGTCDTSTNTEGCTRQVKVNGDEEEESCIAELPEKSIHGDNSRSIDLILVENGLREARCDGTKSKTSKQVGDNTNILTTAVQELRGRASMIRYKRHENDVAHNEWKFKLANGISNLSEDKDWTTRFNRLQGSSIRTGHWKHKLSNMNVTSDDRRSHWNMKL